MTVTVTITLSNKPHEVLTEPDITKSLAVPRFEEKAARITEDLRLKQPCVVDFGGEFVHEIAGSLECGERSKTAVGGPMSPVGKSGRPILREAELIDPVRDDFSVDGRADQHPANVFEMFLRTTLAMKNEFVDNH